MLEVKFKKLVEHALTPEYCTEGSAGMDLTAIDHYYDHDHHFDEYGTGLAIEIPPGYVGLIFPRSSISRKSQMLANCVGVLDSDYRGEIKFRFKRLEDALPEYVVGERVGQLIIMPYPEVQLVEATELDISLRSTNGFGSTGA